MESYCECGIKHPGSISHGVSWLVKPTGKRPLERPRRRLEDNIAMDLKEIVVFARNLVVYGHNKYFWRALVNATMNFRIT